ncbi:hypothetical protein EZV73_06045 [Acidaminobacter sp. JC074]|uniref:SWIM zinc finger family protein n=1 Tax=Acidaminobacter sp. JC074 TaxID=2530199 RepID=UPI001F107BD4|nr:SWIM zinc finger family protein [Acidaminobacter sp. JC074]MCH4887121.1 hypothetical protein [Acidaminobacter sp. JC074]
MSFYGRYETAAEKKRKAQNKLKKLMKKDPTVEPVTIEGRTIAKSWWGKAWCTNLESYADYSNRISRGKAYVKQGAVLDLKIEEGKVLSKINGSGSKIYDCDIHIDKLSDERWDRVLEHCQNKISTLDDLLTGNFSDELLMIFKDKSYGLFPSPDEIHFGCSCPDVAYMCKHIAATLYAIGAKFDNDPLFFFTLRQIETESLIKKSIEKKLDNMLEHVGKKTDRTMDASKISDVFGL